MRSWAARCRPGEIWKARSRSLRPPSSWRRMQPRCTSSWDRSIGAGVSTTAHRKNSLSARNSTEAIRRPKCRTPSLQSRPQSRRLRNTLAGSPDIRVYMDGASDSESELAWNPDKSGGEMNVLGVDIGGTNLKFRTQRQEEVIKVPSGPKMTPEVMMAAIKKNTAGWKYDHVSVGFPGPVIHDKP